ncbi:hypothetical protein RCH33_434 [Flavobacterium daejeonense]|nr:hypothetical protein RCH33_434 [Flavobacterium daejeonense]
MNKTQSTSLYITNSCLQKIKMFFKIFTTKKWGKTPFYYSST